MRGDWIIFAIMAAAIGAALAVPAVIFGPNVLRHFQEKRIRTAGLPASGTVVQITETGRHFGIERVPEVTIHLEVSAPGRPTWRATLTRIPSAQDVPFFMPGHRVDLRYDPNRPERVAVMP
ncbi:DUF3592 domain-containing protein [Roseomonas sp. CECT 9278]|uniref:DUF3592 domain-containing protein n=1 Tax=Roseomonas sp. CECT 9278 TaxID=2845823 RepID=UPI001E5238C9|nr:DUF3592 domain-containing protein [Roseomonas sp. CECT 9278]CAH0249407.1 hypothetical protein ROS9278_03104 [Roseomonas sp. CECT 9278]